MCVGESTFHPEHTFECFRRKCFLISMRFPREPDLTAQHDFSFIRLQTAVCASRFRSNILTLAVLMLLA